MICENDYCIYWTDNSCILDDIYLDNLGICTSCIRISIPKKDLDEIRERQLIEIEDLSDEEF